MLAELRKKFHDDIRKKELEGIKSPIRKSLLKKGRD